MRLSFLDVCFRTNLKLESLEDAVVLEEMEQDLLSDKHGCPAYVSPEILKRDAIYSGRAADMWGLGVMLYTMLVGRSVTELVTHTLQPAAAAAAACLPARHYCSFSP